MTLRDALLQGTKLLEQGVIPVPRLTAEVLLCHAVHCERPYLYAHPEQELREVEWLHYGRYLHERLKGKPTQYITKKQEFYGREFLVTPDVLIPRPETEHLVAAALPFCTAGACVLDVGTGSGAIAVTLSLEAPARVFGADISPAALTVARENATRLNSKVEFIVADLLETFAPSSLDVVVSNPPYVPDEHRHDLQREVRDYEPEVALFGGPGGFTLYDRIVTDAARVLRPGGVLLMELGFTSLQHVSALFDENWSGVEVVPDLAGIPRVIQGVLSPQRQSETA